MKLPKIIFKYSQIYDLHWKELYEKTSKEVGEYPTAEEIGKYIETVEKLWSKDSEKILTAFSDITSLDWIEDKIICYVVGYVRPFSDPLTIAIYKNYSDYFIDVLTHELVHQIFIQNNEKTKDYWKYTAENYKNETLNTRSHIPVHAICAVIYETILGEDRTEIDKTRSLRFEDYKRAWEIVDEEGSEKIIGKFKSLIKS